MYPFPGPGRASTGAGEPTFTDVQGKYGVVVTSGTTVAVTLTSAPTAGNLVVCSFYTYPTTLTISDVQDNASTPNSYTVTSTSPSLTNTSARAGWIAYLLNAPSGAGATITVTTSAAITYNSDMRCEEFHRSSGTWTYDTSVAGSGTTGTTINSPSITPSVSGELLYGMATVAYTSSFTSANSPWTQDSAGIDTSHFATDDGEYILSGSGTTAINFTQASSGVWNGMAVAFK